MNASALPADRLVKNVKRIGTRNQSVHDAHGQQYLFVSGERHTRTAHDPRRTDILSQLLNGRCLDGLILGHDDRDTTNRSFETPP